MDIAQNVTTDHERLSVVESTVGSEGPKGDTDEFVKDVVMRGATPSPPLERTHSFGSEGCKICSRKHPWRFTMPHATHPPRRLCSGGTGNWSRQSERAVRDTSANALNLVRE